MSNHNNYIDHTHTTDNDMLFESFPFDTTSLHTPRIVPFTNSPPVDYNKLYDKSNLTVPTATRSLRTFSDDMTNIIPLSPLVIANPSTLHTDDTVNSDQSHDIQPLYDMNDMMRPGSPTIIIPKKPHQKPHPQTHTQHNTYSKPIEPMISPTPYTNMPPQSTYQQPIHNNITTTTYPVNDNIHHSNIHHQLENGRYQHTPVPQYNSTQQTHPYPINQSRYTPQHSPMHSPPPQYTSSHTQQHQQRNVIPIARDDITVDTHSTDSSHNSQPQTDVVYCPNCKAQFSGSSDVLPTFYRHVGLCHLQSQHLLHMHTQSPASNIPMNPLSRSQQHISDADLHACLQQLGDNERQTIMVELQRLLRNKESNSESSSTRSANSSDRSYNRTLPQSYSASDQTGTMNQPIDFPTLMNNGTRYTPSPAVSGNTPETHTSSEFTPHTSHSSPSPEHTTRHHTYQQHNTQYNNYNNNYNNNVNNNSQQINVHVNVNTQPNSYNASIATPSMSYTPTHQIPIQAIPNHPLRRTNTVPDQAVLANVVESNDVYNTNTTTLQRQDSFTSTQHPHSYNTPSTLLFANMKLGSSPATPMMLPQSSTSASYSNTGSYIPTYNDMHSPSHQYNNATMKKRRADSMIEIQTATLANTPKYVPRDSIPSAIPVIPGPTRLDQQHSQSYNSLSSSYNGTGRYMPNSMSKPVMRRNSSVTQASTAPYPAIVRDRHHSSNHARSAMNSPARALSYNMNNNYNTNTAPIYPATERSHSFSNRRATNNFDFNVHTAAVL